MDFGRLTILADIDGDMSHEIIHSCFFAQKRNRVARNS